MNARRATALLTLPAALALAACSSSTGGSGSTNPSGGAGSSSSSPAAKGGGTSSSSNGGGSATDAAGLGKLLQSGMANVRTAHVDLTIAAAGQTITGTGDEKLDNGKLQAMDLTMTLPGGVGEMNLLLVNGKAYAKLPAQLNKTGKPYVLLSENSSDPTIKELASTLNQSLSTAAAGNVSTFVSAAESVKSQGPATVDGTKTNRYTVVVNTAKLPASYPGKAALAAAVPHLPVDLWVDGQGRTVQVTEKFSASGESVSTKVLIDKYNAPVTITAPPASEVGTG